MQLQINLTSRTYVNRRGLYGFYIILGSLLIVMLAFNTSYFLRLRVHAAMLTAKLAEVTRNTKTQDPAADQEVPALELEKRRRDVALANIILQRDGFRWTDLLDKLEDVAVDGVSIRSIQPNFKEDSLGLTAVARDVYVMQEYLDRLLTSPNFSEVYLLSQSTLKDAEGSEESSAVAFSIDLKGVF